MKFITIIMYLAISLPSYADVTGKAKITDGDTIVINEIRIRLHGIDTPEKDQQCISAQSNSWLCGTVATQYLKSLIQQKTVSCIEKDIDRYGRVVAVCFVDDQDINALMVKSGNALAYRYYSKDYIDEEDEAKSLKKGLWAGTFIEPWEWRKGKRLTVNAAPSLECNIKGNISSKGVKIYHVPSGRYYSQTKITEPKGEKYFCSEGEAVAAGWRRSK